MELKDVMKNKNDFKFIFSQQYKKLCALPKIPYFKVSLIEA